MSEPLRLGAMISGSGRTLLNLADRIDDGTLPATIALAVSSRRDAGGVPLARDRGLEVRVATRSTFASATAMHDAITAWLVEREVQLVCLCGYLRWFRIDPPFEGRVMNIHPALLPEFGGKGMHGQRVHRTVLAARRRFSGCTVHFADDRYDHGPIILQRICRVLPDDDEASLARRVFAQERLAYPEAVRLFAEGRLRLADGRARIIPAAR